MEQGEIPNPLGDFNLPRGGSGGRLNSACQGRRIRERESNGGCRALSGTAFRTGWPAPVAP
jgi:hypothetical protein